jgi:aspartate racemase
MAPAATKNQQGERICGVVGGLGPEATIAFLQLILQKTKDMYGAEVDQHHVHTVVEMNPHVPNRNHAIAREGEDCGKSLRRMAANLSAAGVDFTVCACNTAHAWQESMVEGCGDRVPFVSMIEVSCDAVLARSLSRNVPARCGILGGVGCIRAGLFQRALSRRGVEPVCPSQASQDLLQDIIYRIKAGKKASVIDDFVAVLRELKEDQQCSQIILGCTELPLIVEPTLERYPGLQREDLLDTTDVMVETIVRLCKRDLELEDLRHTDIPERTPELVQE